MKKTIAILLSVLLLACVAGCAAEKSVSEPEETQSVAAAEPTEAPETSAAPEASEEVEESEDADTESSDPLDYINATLVQSGYQVVDSEIGSGSTAFNVYVVSGYSTDAKHIQVSTDESTLLAALQGVNLVDGENASWGYNITTVDGLTADYDGKSEYWTIFVYDADEDQFVSLETAVDATPIYPYSVFMFKMDKG